MYIPKHFEQPSVEAMHALMRAHPLATLITSGSAGICVNHIPMHLAKVPAPYGLLAGHVPRANPVWREASSAVEAVIVFQGPNAYITPSWYPSKQEHGKVVPTWNYVVVHARGHIRVIEDAQWLRTHLERITDEREAPLADPWAVSDAPREFTDTLLGALVGIEIVVTTLVGKWKVSQNRPEPDRVGVIAGLSATEALGASQMADLVTRGGH